MHLADNENQVVVAAPSTETLVALAKDTVCIR
jgi:hypothetical protein